LRRLHVFAAIAIVIVAASAFLLMYQKQNEPKVLKIFCADSVLYPLQKVATAYMGANPNSKVEIEGHGSIQVIRHVTELNFKVDLLVVADYSLIPMMMYNTTNTVTNESYTDWYIRFSGNSLVLAYTDKSKYADEITADNWVQILKKPDVKIGTPDPLIDSLGYRSLMTLQLAENYYNDPSIFETLLGNNFEPVFESVDVQGKTIIFVPEIIKPINNKVTLRASTPETTPLLESGQIDYLFMYISNAKQSGFKYINLPAEINLGDVLQAGRYSGVEVRFVHQRFGTVAPIFPGGVIYYGLSIPSNAPNPTEAVKFVEYMLKGEGKTIFDDSWHQIFVPSYTDHIDAVPVELRSLLVDDPLGR
jgi:molybdate/tungstate transport system substrate-binding protein